MIEYRVAARRLRAGTGLAVVALTIAILSAGERRVTGWTAVPTTVDIALIAVFDIIRA